MDVAGQIAEKAMKALGGNAATYLKARNEPIMENACLFEAGQGKNVNGNMFALIRELSWNEDFSDFKAYFVTTPETNKLARSRLARYGISARTVRRESEKYEELLARCKFLFTDNSFPTYFHKRPEQVYVNTWHGTPLKQLGRSNIKNSLASFANVQKNMLSADVLLFPNELTKQCFFKDYMLEKLFAGKYVMGDYPRNDALVDPAIRQVVREREGMADQRAVAFMPTWRGGSRQADVRVQARILQRMLSEMDALLSDDTVVYVNLHFLLSDTIKYSKFRHIKQFPGDYETYDFLAACDVLVTDYSSVFFDFAVTGREILLYPYDRDEYFTEVGTYLPYEDLPFPVAESVAELAEMIVSGRPVDYGSFLDEYCAYHTGHSTRDLLEAVCLGRDSVDFEDNASHSAVKVRYASGFVNRVASAVVADEMAQSWPEDGLLVFAGRNNPANVDFLSALPANVSYLSVTMAQNLTIGERILCILARNSMLISWLGGNRLKSHYESEFDRLFPGITIDDVVLYVPDGSYLMSVLGTVDGDKIARLRRNTSLRVRARKAFRCAVAMGNWRIEQVEDLKPGDCSFFVRRVLYNAPTDACLLTRFAGQDSKAVYLRGLAVVRAPRFVKPGDMDFALSRARKVGRLSQIVRIGDFRLMHYQIRVFKQDFWDTSIYNTVYFRFTARDGGSAKVPARYGFFQGGSDLVRHSRLFVDAGTGTTTFFRQGGKGSLQFAARDINPLDSLENRLKLNQAYFLSKVSPREDAIVLFEKMSSRYEESASVVYERLIDEGYDNVWFILDDSYPRKDEIPERYRSHIVSRNSLEHYRLFFSAKSFIGSEMLSHSLELHSDSWLVRRRFEDGIANYVFLQHGVMYMVSLDSESRKFFAAPEMKTGKYRTVTSSELEKQHFTDRAHYDDDMLYVCGLPKFDRNEWDPDADLIVVMPTWRPWEVNAARIDFRHTEYYAFLESIVNSIPSALMDKVVVLPHPLFKEYAVGKDFPLEKLINDSDTYDSILRRAKVLITDYSSIAYDAFYRGANVVFYWTDKDACMKNYGESTVLMIDSSTAFGHVAYSREDLKRAVKEAYSRPQDPEHIRRYKKIVEFHDGKNTERLIKMMQDDGII